MKYWNRLPLAARAAVLRFARIFAMGVVATASMAITTHEPLTWAFVGSAVIAAAETAFRAVFPTTPTDPSI